MLLVAILVGCSEPEPIRIGFIGGLSGRVADLGLAGRNGATLAFEELNQAGGVNGRKIELLLADDRQDQRVARQETQRLIEQGVVAIIGPMTSAMATAIVPLINDQRTPLLSPTVTTEALTGLDDYFLRVCSGNGPYSRRMARYLMEKKIARKVAVLHDLGNRAYSESWVQGFQEEFAKLGGELVLVEAFQSGPEVHFSELAAILKARTPDAILAIASAMDTAMLAQQLHKLNGPNTLVGTAWSATEQLISMGGQAVEGMLLEQFFDRQNQDPGYLKFRASYQQRFREEPGFASVAAYDAARVIAAALAKAKGADLKETILRTGRFSGIQQSFSLDPYGDAFRQTHIITVKEGQFFVLD